MPRSTTTAQRGHNSGEPLTDEQKSALLHHHLIAVRKLEQTARVIKATYDAAKNDVSKAMAACKGDLGFKRKDLEDLLAALDMTEAEFRMAENARRKRYSMAGLPIGEQLDMFAADTVGDRDAARADGYRAGLRADDFTVPERIDPLFHADWQHGWSDGQAENGRRLALAIGIIEERAKPEPASMSLDDEDQEDALDPDEVIDDAARALKRSGWTKPAAAEAEFEAA
jgi:hypothetical protein